MLKPPRRMPQTGKETREIRIFSGEPHNVITLDGKIIKDLGPIKKDPNITQLSESYEKYKEKQEDKSSKLQIIPDDEVAGKNEIEVPKAEIPKAEYVSPDQCPQCKSKNVEPSLYLDNAIRYQCKDCNETFVTPKIDIPAKTEPIIESPKTEHIIESPPKTETPIVESPPKTETPIIESPPKIEPIVEPPKIETPIVEIPKIIVPKVEPQIPPKPLKAIPKVEITKTSAQKEGDKKGVNVAEDSQPQLQSLKTDSSQKPKLPELSKVKLPTGGQKMPEKAKIKEEEPKVELPEVDLSKMLSKEVKYMADENAEKQIDEILKKREFQRNIEDAVKFALESKDRIKNISQNIDEVEQQVGTVNKSVGELCDGVSCIKSDIKKSQEIDLALQKEMSTKFEDLAKRIQKLEQPTFVCDNCGEPAIKPLSSFCPNCGEPINQWTDENGMPVKGWTPYWKRMTRMSSPGEEVQ